MIKNSWLTHSDVFDKSVSQAPNAIPLSIVLFHFSIKAKRHWFVLKPAPSFNAEVYFWLKMY